MDQKLCHMNNYPKARRGQNRYVCKHASREPTYEGYVCVCVCVCVGGGEGGKRKYGVNVTVISCETPCKETFGLSHVGFFSR